MNGLMITLEEDKRFLCVWLFYVSRFMNGATKISIKSVLLHEINFFPSVFSSSEVLSRVMNQMRIHIMGISDC